MQHYTLRKVVLSFAVVFVAAGALTLLGCGGDDGEDTLNVRNSVALNAATAAGNDAEILQGKTFTVPGSVLAANASTPALAAAFQNTTTALTFTDITGTTGTFATANPTTSGNVRFGSCIFTITAPANLAGTITIANCSVTITASGVPVGGGSVIGTMILILNGTSSTNTVNVTVALSADGTLIVDGEPVTSVVTGSSGG